MSRHDMIFLLVPRFPGKYMSRHVFDIAPAKMVLIFKILGKCPKISILLRHLGQGQFIPEGHSSIRGVHVLVLVQWSWDILDPGIPIRRLAYVPEWDNRMVSRLFAVTAYWVWDRSSSFANFPPVRFVMLPPSHAALCCGRWQDPADYELIMTNRPWMPGRRAASTKHVCTGAHTSL